MLTKARAVKSSTAPAALQLGGVTLTSHTESSPRMAILLWGPAAVGKSTYAATAPGKKLWLTIGDNEHASVSHRDDVLVADFSGMDLAKFWQQAGIDSPGVDDPFGLDRLLSEQTDIETVVLDSLTAATYRALQKVVILDKQGAGKRGSVPTMEAPGIPAYGGRNALMLQLVTGLLKVTAKHKVHIILTAHEADPVMKKTGDGSSDNIVDYITVMLGGQIMNNMTWRLSEIWLLSESNNRRSVAFRPTRLRKPMKSRMFIGTGTREFKLKYDADKPDRKQPDTIAAIYQRWTDSGFSKIPPPEGVAEE